MAEKKIEYKKTKKFLSFIDYIIQINTLLLIIGAGFVLYEFQHQFQEIREIMLGTVKYFVFQMVG